MEELLNDRKIRFVEYSTEKNWLDQLPNKDWLCILVVNDKPRRYVDEVISKILTKVEAYVCTIGGQCELVHDLIDEEISFREVDIENLYLPKHQIMTTWHHDFEDGIWFAIYAAHNEEVSIKEIVFLDMTNGIEISRIDAAINKIRIEAESES